MGIEYTNALTGDRFEIATGSDIYVKKGSGEAFTEWADLPAEVRDELWQFASRAEELMDSLKALI